MPNISVILPFYNAEKYIQDTIKSVLNQTYEDFEIILINDGSSDNTEDKILDLNPPKNKFTYIKNPTNLGVSISRVIAQKISDSKYIAVMDADDICERTRFENSINFLENNEDISLLSTQFSILNQSNSTSSYPSDHGLIKLHLMFECIICHPTVFFKREILNKVNYRHEFTKAHDYDFYLQCISSNLKIHTLGTCELQYRVHPESSTRSNPERVIKESSEVRRRFIPEVMPNIDKQSLEAFLFLLEAKIPQSIQQYVRTTADFDRFFEFSEKAVGVDNNLFKLMLKNLWLKFNNHLMSINFISERDIALMALTDKSIHRLVY